MIEARLEQVRELAQRRDLEAALALAIEIWRETRIGAIADLVDELDAYDDAPVPQPTSEWLAAARAATTYRERGALLRTLRRRPGAEILIALAVAAEWDDPRLMHVIRSLLDTPAVLGKRAHAEWRAVFAAAARLRDVRFRDGAEHLPNGWTEGSGDLRAFLGNRIGELVDKLRGEAQPEPLEQVAAPDAIDRMADAIAAARPPTTEALLLDAIYAHPDDDGPRAVYADWLQQRGDSRGELIALQLAATPARKPSKRERLLLAEHGRTLLGPLSRYLLANVVVRRGFVVRGDAWFPTARAVERAMRSRAWATVEHLGFVRPGFFGPDGMCCIHPAMTSLRVAEWVDVAFVLGAAQPWPRLETLSVEVDRARLRALCMSLLLPRLSRLVVRGSFDPRTAMIVGPEPSWLIGLDRGPAHLELFEPRILDDVARAPAYLAAAPSPIQTLTFVVDTARVRFARDGAGPFTRLDVEIRHGWTEPKATLTALRRWADALPRKSLSHAEVRMVIGSEIRRDRKLERAVRRAVR